MQEIGKNRAKAKLAADELVLCMGVNQMRTPNVAMIAASCGFDAIYVDLEHNPTALETTAGICVAALGVGITPIVRISSRETHDISRVLDVGAQGIMVPHVSSEAEARGIASACLFPPVGHRSAAGTLPSLGYRPMPQAEVNRVINRETLVMAMIETPEAVASADAMAAVEGIDVLHIGASDLSAEMGVAGEYKHERMRDAYARVMRAARAHGKAMGIGGVRGDPEFQAELLQLGVRYLTCGSDVGYVVSGGRADIAAIRAMTLR